MSAQTLAAVTQVAADFAPLCPVSARSFSGSEEGRNGPLCSKDVNNASAPGQRGYEGSRSPETEIGKIEVSRVSRTQNYALRWKAHEVGEVNTTTAGCGSRLVSSEGASLCVIEGRAFYRGVRTCSAIWVCPPCAAKIRSVRGQDIASATRRWLRGSKDKGRAAGGVVFVTLTLRHLAKHDLNELYSALAEGWRNMSSGRAGARMKEEFGIEGSIRATEVTWGGVNGWHPHLHILMLTKTVLTPSQRESLAVVLLERWSAQSVKHGLGSLLDAGGRAHAVHIIGVTVAEDIALYLTKIQCADGTLKDLGSEMARGDLKYASKGRTPFQMLSWMVDHDSAGCCMKCLGKQGTYNSGNCSEYRLMVSLWRQFVATTKGRRCIEWSKGLKALLDIGEVSDAVAAEEAQDVVETVLALIRPEVWSYITRNRLQPWLLDVAEHAVTSKLAALLAQAEGTVYDPSAHAAQVVAETLAEIEAVCLTKALSSL